MSTPLNFLQASVRADELVANEKLAIGTNSQTSELHIKADAPEIRLEDRVGAEASETATRIYADSGNTYIQSGVNFTDGSSSNIVFGSMGNATEFVNIGAHGIETTGNLFVNNLEFTQTQGLDQILNVSNTTSNIMTLTNTSDDALNVAGGMTLGSNLAVNTDDLFVDTQTGRVGVGMTNPAYELDVAGTAHLSNIASTDYSKQFAQTYDLNFDDITATDEELSLFQFEPNVLNHAIIQGEVSVEILSRRAQTFMHFNSQKVKIKFSFSWDARNDTGSWLVNDIFVDRIKSTAVASNFLIYPVEVRYKYKGDRSTDPDIPPKVQVYLRYNGSNFVAKINVNGMYHSNYTDYGLSFPSSVFATDSDTTDASVDTIMTYDISSGSGNVGIGTDNPQAPLHVNATSGMIIPSGTAAQQPTGQTGMLRFNTTLSRLQVHDGTSWKSIKGVGATGGTVTYVGGYTVHTFKTDGTFIVSSGGEIDVLMVGGGGGGGADNGGGAGAGGLIFRPGLLVDVGSYTIDIGPGGTGAVAQGTTAGKGSNTTAFGLTALGGGYGNNGHSADGSANSGGSGGGGDGERGSTGGSGTQPSQSGDSGTYGYGNDGGGTNGSDGGGGGGGGAGVDGGNGGNNDGGTGGDGLNEVTVNGTVYNFAEIFGTTSGEIISGEAWFAGGGAGGNKNAINTSISGGKGGGGGTANYYPSAGTANTGGGGGGSAYTGSTVPSGANGGSGIVIIRYLS